MLALLLFPILITGFTVCHIHPYHKNRLHRYEGQFLYLKSAQLGSMCFLFALVLTFVAHSYIPDRLHIQGASTPPSLLLAEGLKEWLISADVVEEQKHASNITWFLILSANMFIVGYLYRLWGIIALMRRYEFINPDLAEVFAIGEILQDSPLDSLLFQLSLDTDKYAMLTMSDRKVYVGKIISLGEPSETDGIDQDIEIVPIMSGYRTQDHLKVEFTTYYDHDHAKGKIRLSLRQPLIISATEFSFDAYEAWQDAESESEAPSSNH